MPTTRVEPEWKDTKIVKRYVHANNDELSDLWDAEADQQREYHYSLYEVEIDLEVDMPTGCSRIVAVDGKQLND